jgi:hypothetical protein
MALTLISTHRITVAGFAVNFKSHNCNILSPAPECKLIASIPQVNGLYTIAAPVPAQERTNIAKLTVLCELHRVLGHVLQGAVLHAVKEGLVEGVVLDAASVPEFCDTCTMAKAARQPFPEETKNCTRTYGELIRVSKSSCRTTKRLQPDRNQTEKDQTAVASCLASATDQLQVASFCEKSKNRSTTGCNRSFCKRLYVRM